MRLFDCYCHLKHQEHHKKGEKKSKNGRTEHILDNQNESKLTVLACFFSAAKFEEIYPPSLNDFLYDNDHNYPKKTVILRELDII